jgi:hypothetical protein
MCRTPPVTPTPGRRGGMSGHGTTSTNIRPMRWRGLSLVEATFPVVRRSAWRPVVGLKLPDVPNGTEGKEATNPGLRAGLSCQDEPSVPGREPKGKRRVKRQTKGNRPRSLLPLPMWPNDPPTSNTGGQKWRMQCAEVAIVVDGKMRPTVVVPAHPSHSKPPWGPVVVVEHLYVDGARVLRVLLHLLHLLTPQASHPPSGPKAATARR